MSISHVFDTYAKTAQGRIMHFDVVLDEKNNAKALGYAKSWIESIGIQDAIVTQENCIFCHRAETPSELLKQINSQGYASQKLTIRLDTTFAPRLRPSKQVVRYM